jgi:hypothetical protein
MLARIVSCYFTLLAASELTGTPPHLAFFHSDAISQTFFIAQIAGMSHWHQANKLIFK